MTTKLNKFWCLEFGLPRHLFLFWAVAWIWASVAPHTQLRAQTTPIPEKAKEMYQRALKFLQEKDYESATEVLESTLNKYPQYGKAQLTLAELYLQAGQVEKARIAFEKLDEREPELSFRPVWHLAKLAHADQDFQSSKTYWSRLLNVATLPEEIIQEARKGKIDADFALEAKRRPVEFAPVSLGSLVNSKDDEYIPLYNADHSQLIFTRLVDGKQEDLMSVRFAMGLPLDSARALPPPLNSPSNEGGHTMSQDGRFIIFTACNRADGKGSCDLYSSKFTSAGWSKPENLGSPINTSHWESQPSLSFDGRTLYFTSKRPGGRGGSDIWMSRWMPTGVWSTPIPLDSNVNTPGDEKFPFIHHDDQTLYFTSTGHPGMGKSDLFMARRNSSGSFLLAVNLGYPINSTGEENGLFVTREGQSALMSSERAGGYGRGDLYQFELPVHLRPFLASFVAGSVVDSISGRPIEAQVEIIRLSDQASVFKAQTLPSDGSFLTSLPRGERYALQVQKSGYLFHSQHFDLNMDTANKRYMVPLSPIRAGREVILQNVFFAPNESQLDTFSRAEILKLSDFLRQNMGIRLEIQGHTDDIGSDMANLELSSKRAKSVYDALVVQGVDPKRMSYKGYGESRPISENESQTGKSKNRRTSFVVLPD